MAQMNLSARQKLACRHSDQEFLLPRVREGGRMRDWSFGLADANYYI